MYAAVLTLHSWLRWAVLLLGLLVIARAIAGKSARRPWNAADDRMGALFSGAVDLQMLLGLWLYFFLSPFTRAALRDFGAAMGNTQLRFWAVEHLFGMAIAVLLAHVAKVRVRRMPDPVRKHGVALLIYGLALAAILVSIPWPGLPAGRPLLRW